MDNRQEAIRRATLARQVIDHESYKEAFAVIRELIEARLWESAASEGGGRPSERLCAMAWAVQQLENVFAIVLSGGEFAKTEIEMENAARAKAEQALERIRDYG